MSDTIFTWAVSDLERNVADGKVTTVHYAVNAFSDTYSAGAYGSLDFDGKITTPFPELTHRQVVGWVMGALGGEKMTSICETLQARLDEQRAPTTIAGVPW